MKKFKTLFIIMICVCLAAPYSISSSHSGRTDSYGGHHDNKNASGLGSYHYHCGGYPPHLHKNGICPYSSAATSQSTTKPVSKYYKSSTVKKVQKRLNKLGYKCGTPDGIYGSKTKSAIKKYQRKKGMTINGKINKSLLKKMKITI